MKPRPCTQDDINYWSQTGEPASLSPMYGRHLGAEDIPAVVRQGSKIHVAWVIDDRDEIAGLREGLTIWTTFHGGMTPTDVVIL